jgi:hypothetical protein
LIHYVSTMDERRQWKVRIPDSSGNEHWLGIAAPPGAGNVVWHIDGKRLVLSPDLLSRVLRVSATAQVLAIRDRNRW